MRASSSAGPRPAFLSSRISFTISAIRRRPSPESLTGPSVESTIWYAVAKVWHSVQFSLTATARLVGVTVSGSPVTSTIWIAIAVVEHSVQLE